MRLSLHCESSWSNDESTLHYRFGSDIFVSNQKIDIQMLHVHVHAGFQVKVFFCFCNLKNFSLELKC